MSYRGLSSFSILKPKQSFKRPSNVLDNKLCQLHVSNGFERMIYFIITKSSKCLLK